ncbi:hypothetical protein [Streptomyces xinghaiensis]|uniref:hypothetical protein n=1 Tax=Streptomyces xinghaiensis TaxID=1038928 RepID=UPI000BAFF2C9|nr:hypothetical protein [Streptomyces xinghaiensis]MZE76940.1 hypothetical protein [Streptomyces sp. SID5475]
MSSTQTSRTRRKKPVWIAAGVLVAVAAVTSSYLWWNTDVLGSGSFCDGRLESGDVRSALDSTGRVSQVRAQVDSSRAEFACTVERTSRFAGGEGQRITVKTHSEEGAFPFTTAVWKKPASRSYFKDRMTGAVSSTRGYVVLPESCWDKVGGIQGSRVVFSGDAPVATVEAVVEKGSADRAGLARLLTHSARQVAEKAGCAAPAGTDVPALAAPDSPRATDVRNACGLPGFSLPEEAVPAGRAEPDREVVNDASAHTWACDMHLAGPDKAHLSFAVTTDDSFVEAAPKGKTFRTLPDGKGVATTDEAVLKCKDNNVYFTVRGSFEYDRALKGADVTPTAYVRVLKGTFQNFLDAAADTYSCPRVDLL